MAYREAISLTSNDKTATFHDVTDEVQAIIVRSGITDGLVNVYSHHTTCSVITQELAFDRSMTGLETLQQDFVDALARFAPRQTKEGIYLHPGPEALAFAAEHGEDARGCHNTDAHLRSALVGRSETIPIINGRADLGEFGRIFLVDMDETRGRNRQLQVTVFA